MMAKRIQTKKGLDIAIEGKPKLNTVELPIPDIIKIIPDHYPIIPKLSVRVGDKLEAGSAVLFDKNNPDILVTSPVSGEVLAINRGERRKILDITIAVDKTISYKSFDSIDWKKATADNIKTALLESGMWTYIKQRPYDCVANPALTPKAIFISTYDSAPLAPSYEYIVKEEAVAFQKGVDIIAKLTAGKVYLGVKANSDCNIFTEAKNVEVVRLDGPHPVGNPSVMIQQLEPMNKGNIMWTISLQAVLFIGRFATTGSVNFTKKVALSGPEVRTPQYYQTIVGAGIEDMIKDNVFDEKHLRYISGNVLTGTKIALDGCVAAADNQVTVIAEGDEVHEMIGWGMPRFNKFSVSRSYFSWLLRNKITPKFDARIMGGKRAIIMSGEYDNVFPFDIFPEYLIKAMITKDIDRMEVLGIYEVIPEDFALCEFVCTSKLEIQKIAQEAIDYMRQEME